MPVPLVRSCSRAHPASGTPSPLGQSAHPPTVGRTSADLHSWPTASSLGRSTPLSPDPPPDAPVAGGGNALGRHDEPVGTGRWRGDEPTSSPLDDARSTSIREVAVVPSDGIGPGARSWRPVGWVRLRCSTSIISASPCSEDETAFGHSRTERVACGVTTHGQRATGRAHTLRHPALPASHKQPITLSTPVAAAPIPSAAV